VNKKLFNACILYDWLAADPANCRSSIVEMAKQHLVSTTKIYGALQELIGSGKIEKKKGTHRNIIIKGGKNER
jgi:hypothetical protein